MLQIARPLDETDSVLGRLRLLFGLLIAAGAAAGALFGRLLARPAVRPVERLAEAAEEVRSTGDLSRRVDATGRDELGRLGVSFNAMLGALRKPSAASGSWLPTRRTSCGRRSPACARTSRCCGRVSSTRPRPTA